jgi:hypothetical protein
MPEKTKKIKQIKKKMMFFARRYELIEIYVLMTSDILK